MGILLNLFQGELHKEVNGCNTLEEKRKISHGGQFSTHSTKKLHSDRSTLNSVPHLEGFDSGHGCGDTDYREDDCTGEQPGVSAGEDVEVEKAVDSHKAMSLGYMMS